ncbi:MAG: SAM-dependent methyltransferase [Eubacterium sp.]|nr:SAM-dependent methyltransferase [Eubacterium sp.]
MTAKGKPVRLSPRLKSIAGLVTPGNRLADIGTDHAHLPIWLCQQDIIPSAIAADLRPGPLDAAAANIRQACLSERIETRLSDGLSGFREGEADTLTIAGMGGRLICRILGQKPELTNQFREILLQPQSEIGEVRRYLAVHGCSIVQETCTEDEGKFYPVIRAVPVHDRDDDDLRKEKEGHSGSDRELTEEEMEYGPCLLRDKNPLLKSWLTRRLHRTECILADLRRRDTLSAAGRYEELKKEEQLLRTALAYYEM